ncbi:ParB/RepB/Spo0J family partition protein [Cardiobacteriaceae bacterium TAE3-ERU3]|nr:ParB/RepB/Spo0J family partition protein [Cardiobacteriaceae bacterium TAE3-ERU3]
MSVQKKRGLGRSLDALIGDIGQSVLEQPEFEALKQIDVSRIEPGRYQPRKRFDEEALHELAHSIAEHGVLQPLVVRPIGGERYEIIAGERRFRAGQQAGLSRVPCVVKNYDDRQALAVALIENLQRSDLNVLEVAEGLQQLVEDFTLTHDRVAQLVGRSRSSVTNTLRLLDLGSTAKKALGEGSIEMGHARAMLALSEGEQNALVNEIIRKHLTVRQTEQRVKQIMSGAEPEATTDLSAGKEDISALESQLTEFLGAKIAITHKKKGHGKLVLKYDNVDELERILSLWGFRQ